MYVPTYVRILCLSICWDQGYVHTVFLRYLCEMLCFAQQTPLWMDEDDVNEGAFNRSKALKELLFDTFVGAKTEELHYFTLVRDFRELHPWAECLEASNTTSMASPSTHVHMYIGLGLRITALLLIICTYSIVCMDRV